MIFSESEDGVIDLNDLEDDEDVEVASETKPNKKNGKNSNKNAEDVDVSNLKKQQKEAYKKKELSIMDAELAYAKSIIIDDDDVDEAVKESAKYLLDIAEKYKKLLLEGSEE